MVAEVSESTCTTHFPGMTNVTLCLVPFAYIRKYWEVTLKVHYFLNFVYSSIHGEVPLQTAYTQSYPAETSVVGAEECVTAAQAARLDFLYIEIQDLV